MWWKRIHEGINRAVKKGLKQISKSRFLSTQNQVSDKVGVFDERYLHDDPLHFWYS